MIASKFTDPHIRVQETKVSFSMESVSNGRKMYNKYYGYTKIFDLGSIGVRARGKGGGAAPPVSEIFRQNAQNSGNEEMIINDSIKKK